MAVMPSALQMPCKSPSTRSALAGIEACHRFVGENEGGLLHQRARDADALLLSAGQLVGAAQRMVDQADAFDGIQRHPLFRAEMAAGCERLEWYPSLPVRTLVSTLARPIN